MVPFKNCFTCRSLCHYFSGSWQLSNSSPILSWLPWTSSSAELPWWPRTRTRTNLSRTRDYFPSVSSNFGFSPTFCDSLYLVTLLSLTMWTYSLQKCRVSFTKYNAKFTFHAVKLIIRFNWIASPKEWYQLWIYCLLWSKGSICISQSDKKQTYDLTDNNPGGSQDLHINSGVDRQSWLHYCSQMSANQKYYDLQPWAFMKLLSRWEWCQDNVLDNVANINV